MKLKAFPLAASVLALSTYAAAAQTAVEPGAAEAPAGTMQEGAMMEGGSGIISQENLNTLISADELLGANIYSVANYDEATWNEAGAYTTVDANWEDIGEVDDIVMSPDGQLIGLAVETGGWLDIGDDVVLINLDDVRMINDNGDFSVVTRMTQEELESKPQLNEDWWTQ